MKIAILPGDGIGTEIVEQAQRVLNVLVKTDVQGSAEALRDALVKISTDAIKVKFNRNEAGKVESMTMYQAGLEFVMPKEGVTIAAKPVTTCSFRPLPTTV